MKILYLIFFLFAIQTFAQKTDSITNAKILDLKANGIKDFFFVETSCTGFVDLEKAGENNCALKYSEIFLFWNESGKSYVQKINYCKNPKIKIPKKIMNFYLHHYNEIKSEEVKSYQTDADNIRVVDHTCLTRFTFYMNEYEALNKGFDRFDLTTEIDSPNINYLNNTNLKITELAELCEKIVGKEKVN